jgi:putative ATP-dependent endonuclease of the OLD family
MFLSRVEISGYRAASEPFVVQLPDRLCVLVGSNNSGKTTICDSIYQALPCHFPPVRRPISDVVHMGTGRIMLEFSKSGDPQTDPLVSTGMSVTSKVGRDQGKATFRWEIAQKSHAELFKRVLAIYLPADRRPADELARENSLLVVQLLRTVSNDKLSGGSLGQLYDNAKVLLAKILEDPLVVELEVRLRERMTSVAGGSANQVPHMGTSAMSQRLLARILELLLGEEAAESARRLELSGLGYANLLYLAAILTALPPIVEASPLASTDADPALRPDNDGAENGLERAAVERDDGEVFPTDTPLFVLLVEEPEAHLHPQLQAGVLQELRRLVKAIPTLQVILTTHSPEILAMAEPAELIVLPGQQLSTDGSQRLRQPVVIDTLLKSLGTVGEETERMLRLHLDATRSGALFSDEVMLVEGPTDALVFRRLGLAWAASDHDPPVRSSKERFVRALSIVPMNHKVGEWAVRLLATPGFEIVNRVAVVRDSDLRPTVPKTKKKATGVSENDVPEQVAPTRPELTEEWLVQHKPKAPSWLARYHPNSVGVFHTHPTLEPALWRTNSKLVEAAIGAAVKADKEEDVTDVEDESKSDVQGPSEWSLETIDHYFRGSGKKLKGAIGLRIAAELGSADRSPISVPDNVAEAFNFLWLGFQQRAFPVTEDVDSGAPIQSDG